jgi:signal transduction histidine kinase
MVSVYYSGNWSAVRRNAEKNVAPWPPVLADTGKFGQKQNNNRKLCLQCVCSYIKFVSSERTYEVSQLIASPAQTPDSSRQAPFEFSVLIVDDEDEIREQLRIRFELEGCIVFDAAGGNEAFEVWKKHRPDVVITDIRMANGTGEELLELLNKESAGDRSVVICMSGFSDLQTHTAYDCGADALFQKPFDLRALVAAARHFAQIRKRHLEAFSTVSRFQEDLKKIASSMLRTDSKELHNGVDLQDLKQLASMVMHEINGPLAVINMNAALLPETLESGVPRLSSAVKMARNIERNSQKLNDIIHALRDLFVRRDLSHRTPVAMSQVITEAVRHLQEEQKLHGITIQVEGREISAWVKGDRQQLIQVIKNVLDNAAYSNRVAGQETVVVSLDVKGREISISVSDKGHGISDGIRAKIFDPYFSTKGDQGTGMGLHICKQIIENHGGSINLDTKYRNGAKFIITLPQYSQ